MACLDKAYRFGNLKVTFIRNGVITLEPNGYGDLGGYSYTIKAALIDELKPGCYVLDNTTGVKYSIETFKGIDHDTSEEYTYRYIKCVYIGSSVSLFTPERVPTFVSDDWIQFKYWLAKQDRAMRSPWYDGEYSIEPLAQTVSFARNHPKFTVQQSSKASLPRIVLERQRKWKLPKKALGHPMKLRSRDSRLSCKTK